MKPKKFNRVWIVADKSFNSDGIGRWADVTAQTKQYVTVKAPAEYGRFADEKGRLSFTPELGLQVRRLDTSRSFLRQVYAFESPENYDEWKAIRIAWWSIHHMTQLSIPASMTLDKVRQAATLLQVPSALIHGKAVTPSKA